MANAGVVIGVSLGVAVLILVILIFGCKLAHKNIWPKNVKTSPTEHLLYAASNRPRNKRKAEEYNCWIHGHVEASPYSSSCHIEASKKNVSFIPKMQDQVQFDHFEDTKNTGRIPECILQDKTCSGHVKTDHIGKHVNSQATCTNNHVHTTCTNKHINSQYTCPGNHIVQRDYEEFDKINRCFTGKSRKDISERSANLAIRKEIFNKAVKKLDELSRKDISTRNCNTYNRKEPSYKFNEELNDGLRRGISKRSMHSHNQKKPLNEVNQEHYRESRKNISEIAINSYDNKIHKKIIRGHDDKGVPFDKKSLSKQIHNPHHPVQKIVANATNSGSNHPSTKQDKSDHKQFLKMSKHHFIQCNSDVDEKTHEWFHSASGTTVKEIVEAVKRSSRHDQPMSHSVSPAKKCGGYSAESTTASSQDMLHTLPMSNSILNPPAINSTPHSQIKMKRQSPQILPTSTTLMNELPSSFTEKGCPPLSNNVDSKKGHAKSKHTRRTYDNQQIYTPFSLANEKLLPLHTSANVSVTVSLPAATDEMPSLPVNSTRVLMTPLPVSTYSNKTPCITTGHKQLLEVPKLVYSDIERAVVVMTHHDKLISSLKEVSVNAKNHQASHSSKRPSQPPSSFSTQQSLTSNPPPSQNSKHMLDQLVSVTMSHSLLSQQSHHQDEAQFAIQHVPPSMNAMLVSPNQYEKVPSPFQTMPDNEDQKGAPWTCDRTITSQVVQRELNPTNELHSELLRKQFSLKKTEPKQKTAGNKRNMHANIEDNSRSDSQDKNIPLRSNRSLIHSLVQKRRQYIQDSDTVIESDVALSTLWESKNDDVGTSSAVKKSVSLESRVKYSEEPTKSSQSHIKQSGHLSGSKADLPTKIENVKYKIRNNPSDFGALLSDIRAKRKPSTDLQH